MEILLPLNSSFTHSLSVSCLSLPVSPLCYSSRCTGCIVEGAEASTRHRRSGAAARGRTSESARPGSMPCPGRGTPCPSIPLPSRATPVTSAGPKHPHHLPAPREPPDSHTNAFLQLTKRLPEKGPFLSTFHLRPKLRLFYNPVKI